MLVLALAVAACHHDKDQVQRPCSLELGCRDANRDLGPDAPADRGQDAPRDQGKPEGAVDVAREPQPKDMSHEAKPRDIALEAKSSDISQLRNPWSGYSLWSLSPWCWPFLGPCTPACGHGPPWNPSVATELPAIESAFSPG